MRLSVSYPERRLIGRYRNGPADLFSNMARKQGREGRLTFLPLMGAAKVLPYRPICHEVLLNSKLQSNRLQGEAGAV
jgi:hypothetical protein